MDILSKEIGKNIRKYRKLRGLTLEQMAEMLETDTNYLGQCERGERRLSLDKLVILIDYFEITANDVFPNTKRNSINEENKTTYLNRINELIDHCTNNQLALIFNVLKECLPHIKD